MEFFFVSSFWSGHPVEVGKDPFAPYTRELGNLHLEGIFCFFFFFFFKCFFLNCGLFKLYSLANILYFSFRDGNHEGEQGEGGGGRENQA